MKTVSRRNILQAGTAAIILGGLSSQAGSSLAAMPKKRKQVIGAYRTQVGNAEVTALLDGFIDIQPEWWVNTSKEALKEALEKQFLPTNKPLRLSINAYLINTGKKLIAIDTGADKFFGPPAGKYALQLAALGIDTNKVDDVLLTHLHPDHIGGLIAGGKALFPNATVHLNSIDHNYWTSSKEKANAPKSTHSWFDAATNLTNLYDGRLKFFKGETEILPGLTTVTLYGHTPGHSGFILNSNSESLFFWADVIDFLSLQLNNPERTLIFDVDKQEGEKARRKALDMAASDKLQIAGSHIPFPSFGYVAPDKTGYRFVPAEWRYQL